MPSGVIVPFLVVFVAMALTDALYAFYTRRTSAGRAHSAGIFAALLIVTSGVVTTLYVKNPYLLGAAAAGAYVGTALTVHYDRKHHAAHTTGT